MNPREVLRRFVQERLRARDDGAAARDAGEHRQVVQRIAADEHIVEVQVQLADQPVQGASFVRPPGEHVEKAASGVHDVAVQRRHGRAHGVHDGGVVGEERATAFLRLYRLAQRTETPRAANAPPGGSAIERKCAATAADPPPLYRAVRPPVSSRTAGERVLYRP